VCSWANSERGNFGSKTEGQFQPSLQKKDFRLQFSWQSGYAAFSIAESSLESVIEYVRNQEEHHKRITFQDEYRAFLKRHNVPFDERYVWD
jgi:hypothetical protein